MWQITIAIAGLIAAGFAGYLWHQLATYRTLKPRLDRLDDDERLLRANTKALELRQKRWEEQKRRDEERLRAQKQQDQFAVDRLAKEKSVGFPWLAQAYADWFHLRDQKTADALQHKNPPAPRAAEKVREIAAKRRHAERLQRIYAYQLRYYESLFPWLTDYKDELIEDSRITVDESAKEDIADNEDAAKLFLPPSDYKTLPTVERYQRALDNWRKCKKSLWEIGREYERYVGYLWEQDGFVVEYRGIVDGFRDKGRDLIARRGDELHVIQCKRWSKDKTIHEKHIFQLFGTAIECCLQQQKEQLGSGQLMLFPELLRSSNIVPIFVTTTNLSETAKDVAGILGVEVREAFPLEEYPCIKCNVSANDGSKIYHLPFDQQYDRVVIDKTRGECWASTVAEAESLGFRRAMRWRGSAATIGQPADTPLA